MTHPHLKTIPRSVAIFGASGHIGGPMARFLRFHAPQVRLRLIGTTPDKVARLQHDFPGAETVQANYFDPASLQAAVAGIEAMLVLATQPLDEARAMSHLAEAVRAAGTVVHMVRVVGLQPDTSPRRIPQALRDFGLGLEVQHPIAREVLDGAGLPVTYLNVGASYMDNYLRAAPALRAAGRLVWPEREIPYVDPREVGEAAARLLLSDDRRHVGQFYTLNNGEPGLRTAAVAQMMREVFQRSVHHDPSREGFMGTFEPLLARGLVPPTLPHYLWDFFAYEEANAPVWVANQFLERTLGRRPTTLRAWLQEHRTHFFPEDAPRAAG